MLSQIFGVKNHRVNLLPRLGIVHLAHATQAILLQFGSDSCPVILDIPHIFILRHAYQVASYIDIMVGVDGHWSSQRVALQLILHTANSTRVRQALDAVILDIEYQVVWNVHIQFGINYWYFALGIPVTQLPEKLAVDFVLVFYYSTSLHVRDGKLYQIVLLVDLRFHDVVFLHGRLHNLVAFYIEGGSLDVLHHFVAISAKDAF